MGQFYLVLSCDDYLKSKFETILENALKQANNYLKNKKKTFEILQVYYAGQIFFIKEDYKKALECFSLCKGFLPSLCMQLICYDLTGNKVKRNLLIEDLLFLDKHNKGLLKYVYIPKLNLESFEELVMLYSHIREIEGIIPILNDYASYKAEFNSHLYNNIIPKAKDIFKIDIDSDEGKNAIQTIKLWQNEVIEGYCNKFENIFKNQIKDNFLIWNSITDKVQLEELIGAQIPFFSEKKEITFEILDLIDFYKVKEKINYDARYLLAFWLELCKYRNKKLSDYQKKAVKYSIVSLFKIVIGYFGLPYLIPVAVFFIGEQLTKDFFTEKIIQFIEDRFINNDIIIPAFYSDFKKQFTEFFKGELNNI